MSAVKCLDLELDFQRRASGGSLAGTWHADKHNLWRLIWFGKSAESDLRLRLIFVILANVWRLEGQGIRLPHPRREELMDSMAGRRSRLHWSDRSWTRLLFLDSKILSISEQIADVSPKWLTTGINPNHSMYAEERVPGPSSAFTRSRTTIYRSHSEHKLKDWTRY